MGTRFTCSLIITIIILSPFSYAFAEDLQTVVKGNNDFCSD